MQIRYLHLAKVEHKLKKFLHKVRIKSENLCLYPDENAA